jgi:hypothetical protein
MLSLIVSTVVYFVAAYFIKRQLEEMGIPKSMTRGLVVFVLAAAVAYGAAFLIDFVGPSEPHPAPASALEQALELKH